MKKPTLSPDQPLLRLDHRRPRTRREFLSQGFISGAAILSAPTVFSLLRAGTASAQAVTCNIGGGGSGMIPFLGFDLAGGANIAGSNVLVGGPGGQLDLLNSDGYMRLGLPSDMTPDNPGQVNSDLGIRFHSDSALLAGIQSKASAECQASLNGVIFCARSDNDTGNNPHNPIYGIAAAGAEGQLLTLAGTESSDSGGNSMAPASMVDPTIRPTRIASARDATGLVDTGKLIELLSQQDASSVAAAAEAISDEKLNLVAEDPALTDLVRCGYAQTTDLITRFGDPNALDPNFDDEIALGANPIFSAAELGNRRFEKTAAVMKLVVEGFAGGATIENGGYDYHDGTRATGEIRDFLAGQMIGAAVEYAHRRGQALCVYVFSDGAVSSDGVLDNTAEGRGKGVWRGDSSSSAAVFMLVYRPGAVGRPVLTAQASENQIGFYRPSGAVETAASRVSANVALLAEAIVLNYMALHNDVGNFGNVLMNHGLGDATEMDALTAFAPLT